MLLHILQITPRYYPSIGGVEELVKRISELLVVNKFNVTVYTIDLNPTLPKVQEINGVLVKRFKPVVGDPLYFPEPSFFDVIRQEKTEIIHIHNLHTFLPFVVTLLKKKSQKLVLHPHYHRFGQSFFRNCLFKIYKCGLKRVVFPLADVVIANSLYEKRILCEDFHLDGRILLIFEGVDVEECSSVKHNPVEPKRILYVGALRGYKNVDKIIEGFAQLVKNGVGSFKLVIVGDGPERPFLVNLAYKLGINGLVEWKSGLTRQQLLNEYARASVFVHLSPLESFSRVVYEALLIGVPTVVLNFGATEHLVKEGFAEGVSSLSAKEIAEAISKALMRIHSKIEGSNFLSWKEYLNKLIELYHSLV
ncbi:MAG: glycosyltransferase family 4 protein [Candidatus Bathyarchaeia archaeon]